jgi:hypothetical protein
VSITSDGGEQEFGLPINIIGMEQYDATAAGFS